MIKIDKGTEPVPEMKSGIEVRVAMLDALESAYSEGNLDFNSTKYSGRWKYYKKNLQDTHNNKCCYCEQVVEQQDVEHFRPKKKVQQDDSEAQSIGYFWLAFDWENLLLACPKCNRVHKGNFFPLANPSERASPHSRDISREIPLLINPAKEDPSEHIDFLASGFVKALTIKGETTIKCCGLNRNFLVEQRKREIDVFYGHFSSSLHHIQKFKSLAKRIELLELLFKALRIKFVVPNEDKSTMVSIIQRELVVDRAFYAAKKAFYEKQIKPLLESD